jgi:NADPH-dependent glutamate synthase beta subunit-like oxidoreductase/NAD(P)H-flavin reductase
MFAYPAGISQFTDLLTREGVACLDEAFLKYLEEGAEDLVLRLKAARSSPPSPLEESALLLDLGPHVEDFLSTFFSIEKEVSALQAETHTLAPLYRCKRLFVQRQAAKTFSKEEALSFNGEALRRSLEDLMGEPFNELSFARHVLNALDETTDGAQHNLLSLAKQYAAWALHQERPSLLFRLPWKINPEALASLQYKEGAVISPHRIPRHGFDHTDPGVKIADALDQAHYCIACHPQGKDSCSKGLSDTAKGCPLDQKISEMNILRTQGYLLGALAVIMVDNPMVAATGHRICNDCMKACIFQKQAPVNVPSIETQTLDSVLNLPWGVELYSLLSRWNPLNVRRPFEKKQTGYKVLVAGMGPAGFTLAHYLLNEGHTVVGIDALKIAPLDPHRLTRPIRDWHSLQEPLSQRHTTGFGGVAEYGITARWNKNYLTLVRLLLERRPHFSLYDSVRLGGALTLPQAFELGFDHVALCLGAGKPNVLEMQNGLARGVRLASDFLMALQLTGAAQEASLANLQIRLPILVVGGGLTAVDTATEALAYYPVQVNKFLKRTEILGGLPSSLVEEEAIIAEEFFGHAHALRQGDRSFLTKASTIVYRKQLQNSPSYRNNAEELGLALQQGVRFLENATPHEIKVDPYGHIESLVVETPQGLETLPCRTLLVATGTQPNRVLATEDEDLTIESQDILINYKAEERVSFFGDLHPNYSGNVVKAMASAKHGYPKVCAALLRSPPSPPLQDLNDLLAHIEDINRLTPSIIEIIIKAPQAARNFKPGQFFRLMNYGPRPLEGLALTGAHADPDKGLLSLIVLEVGGSSSLCQFLKKGERVSLMGPTGTPTEIPTGETVLLIGGGLGNAVLFPIGRALKEKNNHVIYVAGYKSPADRFKVEEIEAIADHVIWCSEASPGFTPRRAQDFACHGNVIEGLLSAASHIPLEKVTRILTIGSDRMMAAVACARKTVLKPYLNPTHKALASINSPMQCMMKEICGQCIQTHKDPLTGQTRVVFSCANQDQDLDSVDFDVLRGRLQQNSLLERQTHLWAKNYAG